MSILTVFQSYQDDGCAIMKDCAKLNPVYDFHLPQGSNPGLLDQQANA